MSWRYLSEADVAHINERVTGSPDLLAEPLLLRSAVHRQWAGFGDDELYPTLAAKAGALFHGVISNHPFIDANKRTAAYAAGILCDLNGTPLAISDDELVDLAVATAAQPLSVEEVIERFETFVQA